MGYCTPGDPFIFKPISWPQIGVVCWLEDDTKWPSQSAYTNRLYLNSSPPYKAASCARCHRLDSQTWAFRCWSNDNGFHLNMDPLYYINNRASKNKMKDEHKIMYLDQSVFNYYCIFADGQQGNKIRLVGCPNKFCCHQIDQRSFQITIWQSRLYYKCR